LDRIDIHMDVPRVEHDKLLNTDRAEPSSAIRARIERARERQHRRFNGRSGLFANADLGVSDIQQLCNLSPEARQLMEVSMRKLQLSARSYHRVLKLSRTIADLGDSDRIEIPHIAEALQYRPRQLSTS